MSTKVALGIFWDIENCAVPLTKLASSVAKELRDFIADKHPECGYAKEFICVCDTSRVDKRLLIGLEKNGVDVLNVISTAKNAADDKLQERIDIYVETYGTKGPAVLCLITGDINFAKNIRNARRKDLDVVLIHGRNASLDLKNLVNESYLFEDIIKNAENASKADTEIKPVFLEVLNLPTNQSLSAIVNILRNLSANCGGKPGTLSQGKALIKFGTRDDAQRCLQRIDGVDVLGHKIQVRLTDGVPNGAKQKAPPVAKQKSADQSTGPIAAKLKNKTQNQQNSAKKLSKSQTDLTQIQSTAQEGDDSRSTIIGLVVPKGITPKNFVHNMVIGWNDKKLKPELISSVLGPSRKGNYKVLAISPEANKLLVFRSKKYLKDSRIKWFFKEQKPTEASNGGQPFPPKERKTVNYNLFGDNECKSVIKGVDTKMADNVAKIVRKLVESWADKSVQPNYIKTVDRDKKFADKDGLALLFVTTNTPQQNIALLEAANRHLKGGIKWTAYQRKRNLSKDTDTESVVSENVGPTLQLTKRNLQMLSAVPNGVLSVISGLETKKDENVAKTVRKIVESWVDPIVDHNYIKAVDRDRRMADEDGMVRLFVTANTPEYCKALVEAANRHFNDEGKQWTAYQRKPNIDSQSVVSDLSKRNVKKLAAIPVEFLSVIRGVETKKDENVAKTVRKIVESWAHPIVDHNYIKTVERDRKFADKDGTVLLFVTANTPENSKALVEAAVRHFNNDGKQWTAYQPKRNINKNAETESNSSESIEIIPKPRTTSKESNGSKNAKNKTVVVTDDMLSVITGLETKKDENVAKIVRKVVMEWKNPKLNGNLIKDVNRFPDFPVEDGKIPLLVTAISPEACLMLVEGAETYLKPSTGIFWAQFKSGSGDSKLVSNCSEASALPNKPEPMPRSRVTVGTESVDGAVYVPPAIQIFKDCPTKQADSPLFQFDNFSDNHFNRGLSCLPTTAAATSRQPISTETPFPTPHRPDLTERFVPRLVKEAYSVPQYPTASYDLSAHSRKDDSDKNLFKSLVSGFESLFKPSKPSPKKYSVCKPMDSEMANDSYLSSLTPIYCPTVPYTQYFPGGLDEGFTLCIRGRLNTSADWFSINFFVNNSDNAFHFNVRPSQSAVVRNSLINGEWGPEEREIPHFPFSVGLTFDIIIRVQRDRYVVAVNRQHYCDYEHRIAISSVGKLSISEGITIDCLRSSSLN